VSTNTSIEWTDATWNPIRGCSRVSEGCRNCYAERVAARFSKIPNEQFIMTPLPAYAGLAEMTKAGPRWTGEVRFIEEHLADPLKWRKPKRVFVNSMSDLFHEKVQDEWIDRIFAVMAAAPQHTFQILTKRAERMREYMASRSVSNDPQDAEPAVQIRIMLTAFHNQRTRKGEMRWCKKITWPLPNVWLGVSCEDQKTADERIPLLLQTPAAVRFISYEPALEAVDLRRYVNLSKFRENYEALVKQCGGEEKMPKHLVWNRIEPPCLHWVIVGGESGPNSRPFNIQWARDVVAQCKAAGVACFVKQLGAFVISRNDTGFEGDTPYSWPMDTHVDDGEAYQGAPVRVRLKDRKGGDWNEWPEDLRVREYPST
jgi:protein gp37